MIFKSLKWFAILAVISALGYGVKWTYNKHLDMIDDAVNTALLAASVQETATVNKAVEKLRKEHEAEKLALEAELSVSRAKVSDLQRMLLIDHDLDRLLQRKPGLILPRVNKGTEDVLKELEELTQ